VGARVQKAPILHIHGARLPFGLFAKINLKPRAASADKFICSRRAQIGNFKVHLAARQQMNTNTRFLLISQLLCYRWRGGGISSWIKVRQTAFTQLQKCRLCVSANLASVFFSRRLPLRSPNHQLCKFALFATSFVLRQKAIVSGLRFNNVDCGFPKAYSLNSCS
jgi:hypothetical protein